MKILMLNHEFPPIGGGGGYAAYNILRQFSKRTDIVLDVIVSNNKPEFLTEKFADNITLYKVGLPKKALQFWTRRELILWLIKAYRVHKQLIAQNDYDLAHAFFGFPAGLLTWRTKSRLPYIISLRGSDVPGINVRFAMDYRILGPLFRRIWKNADALYACSNGLRQRALNFMPKAEIGVVPNGIELERFCPTDKAGDNKNLRLLTVGRLSASKRIELLLSSMQLIYKKFPNSTLTIAGGGGLEQKLRQMIKAKAMQSYVKMLGVVGSDKMPQLYNEHDIFITATAQEGMSNAMLEAMSCGLPIITTRCEGVEELIHDNGIVVENAQPEEIEKAFEKLADNLPLRKQMSAAARKHAQNFSWKSTADQYLKCYNKVLGNPAESHK